MYCACGREITEAEGNCIQSISTYNEEQKIISLVCPHGFIIGTQEE